METPFEKPPQFIPEEQVPTPKNAIEQEPKYGEILHDESLVFHGVGFDLIWLHR